MRQLAYIILSVFIFTGCSNEKTSKNAQNQIDSLKQNFSTIFNGVWVSTDYINAIEQTKSPIKASEKLIGIVSMILDGTSASDSVEVFASWNNHEGYSFTTYLNKDQKSNSFKTNITDIDEQSNFYELGYETINNETFLFLYHYNKSSKFIDKKRYSKVAEKQLENDPSLGLQYIVNEKLFSGNFLQIDNKKASKKVIFKSDGTLTGSSDFTTYHVFTDFMGMPKTNIDRIVFNLDSKNSKSFAFKKENDTTYLYSTIGNEDAGQTLKLDKLQYKLVRQ